MRQDVEYGEHVTFDNVTYWRMLFVNEGSLAGVTRVLFDSWFKLLVYQSASVLRSRPGSDLEHVRRLLRARLALDTGMRTTDEAKKLFEDLEIVTRTVNQDIALADSFALVCDVLRVTAERREELRACIFSGGGA